MFLYLHLHEVAFSYSQLSCTGSGEYCALDSFDDFGTVYKYTVNHKKRDILFLTITLANINRFLQFLYHFNREEILHATVVKIYHISLIVCAPYLDNNTFQLKTLLFFVHLRS